jgi:single stranded DNA-binding protein
MENIFIIGHIGADASTKQTSDNKLITRFSVACTTQWLDKDTGEVSKKTNWYTVFYRRSKNPEKLLNHLKKGNKVLVMGKPSYQVNTHGQGVKVEVTISATEIEVQTFDNSLQPEKK